MGDVSPLRKSALRAAYLLNVFGAVFIFWPALLNPVRPLGLVEGSAFSLWAAMTTMMALGLRYPREMLPLLFLQLFYKTIWFVAVALPLRSGGQWNATAGEFARTFAIAIAVDLLVIPWGYVFATYVKRPGDSWTTAHVADNTARSRARREPG